MTEAPLDVEPEVQLSFNSLSDAEAMLTSLGLTDDPLERVELRVWLGSGEPVKSTDEPATDGDTDTVKPTSSKGGPPDTNLDGKGEYDPETDEYVCSECGKTFDNPYALGGHQNAHR